jgi:hypothetical protein
MTEHNDTQHNDTQRNATQHNATQHDATQHNDTQHDATQHNATQHYNTQHKRLICDSIKGLFATLSIKGLFVTLRINDTPYNCAQHNNIKCSYGECRRPDCRGVISVYCALDSVSQFCAL